MRLLYHIVNRLVGFDVEEMQSNIEALNGQNTALKNKLSKKEADLAEKVHNMRKLQGKVLSLTNKVATMDSTIAELTSHNEAIKRCSIQLEEQLQQKSAENSRLDDAIDELKTQNEAVVNGCTQLQEQLRQKNAENSRLSDTIADLKTRNEAISSGSILIQEQLQEKSAENGSLNESIAELKRQNEAITNESTQLQEQLQQKVADNVRLNETIAALTALNDEKARVNEHVQDQLKSKCAENDELKLKLENIEAHTLSKSDDKRFLEERIQALEENLTTLTREKSILNGKISEQNEEVESIKKELGLVREENLTLKDEVKLLEEEKLSLQKKLSGIEKEISEVAEPDSQNESNSEKEVESGTSTFREPDETTDDESPSLSISENEKVETVEHESDNATSTHESQEAQENKEIKVSSTRRIKAKSKEEAVLELVKGEIEDFPAIGNDQDHTVQRTIKTIYDEKGIERSADDFFKNSSAEEIARVSRKLSEADQNNNDYYTCGMCHERVKIAHRLYNGRESLFFIHAHADTGHYCPWRKPAIKSSDIKNAYVEVEETIEEDELPNNVMPHSRVVKEKIFSILTSEESRSMGISEVKIDSIVKGTSPYMRWRRPDISFMYGEREMVIELQRRKTPLDTIVDKDIFYRLNNVHVLWVFGSDAYNTYDYLKLSNFKNTMFANHRNVFVFDPEAIKASEDAHIIKLKCNWLDEDDDWAIKIKENGSNGKLIDFSQLTFDDDLCKPYYFDANKEYFAKYPIAKKDYLDTIISKEQLVKQIEDKWTRNPSYEEAIRMMRERGDKAVPSEYGGFWGFRYKETQLIQPIFTTAPQLQKDGYYKVRLNDAWGIVNCYGQKVVDWEDNLNPNSSLENDLCLISNDRH